MSDLAECAAKYSAFVRAYELRTKLKEIQIARSALEIKEFKLNMVPAADNTKNLKNIHVWQSIREYSDEPTHPQKASNKSCSTNRVSLSNVNDERHESLENAHTNATAEARTAFHGMGTQSLDVGIDSRLPDPTPEIPIRAECSPSLPGTQFQPITSHSHVTHIPGPSPPYTGYSTPTDQIPTQMAFPHHTPLQITKLYQSK